MLGFRCLILESYQVIVQAIFNLAYIQALFTIVTEMNKTEQEIWKNIQSKNTKNVNILFLISTS